MRKALLLASALAATAACTGVAGAGTPINASGTAASRNVAVGGFSELSVAGPYRVIVTVGGQPSARAEGDSALLDHTDIRVDGDELEIELRDGFQWSGEQATVYVTAPSLREADLAGSGEVRISPFQADRFEGSVAGSGNLVLERLQAGTAEFDIAGSGDISANGSARETKIEIAGSGNARLSSLQAETARISIAGSGNADLNATGTASVSIAGSGNANIRGGARCDVSRVGSGNANCG